MHLQFLSTETQECLLASNLHAYSLAVAIATAYAVPRPTSLVNNIDEVLANNKKAMEQVVAWFNEVRPINMVDTVDTAGQVWKALYEVAHGVFLENCTCSLSPLDLFGVGFHLSEARAKELCEHHVEVGKVLGACVKAARQMQLQVAKETANV